MNEIWKPIPNYEGLYEISNLGNLKSLKKNGKNKECIKIPIINPRSKYRQFVLYKQCKRFTGYYHRIVANLFIPNPDNLPEVNHIDGDKSNNSVDNLEWCTKAYNRQHALRLGLWKHTDSHKKATSDFNKRTKSKPVLQYDKNGNFIQEFPSTDTAATAIGGGQGNIVMCCNGKYKTVKGFVFRYK